MATCTKPDRDVPTLTCGYPLPCPHHTLVIEESTVGSSLEFVAWLDGLPSIQIGTGIRRVPGEQTQVVVVAQAHYRKTLVWQRVRALQLSKVTMQEIRDAYDELTREAHLELEKQGGIA